MTLKKLFGRAALITALVLLTVSCDNYFQDLLKPLPQFLSGEVTISPSIGATTGTQLKTAYSGNETVTYQWYKDGNVIASGGTGTTYTPSTAGNYTVTVSASGYESMTSAAVTVLSLLSGTVAISPNHSVIIGKELTAVYSDSGTGVTYQWNKDGTPVAPGGTNKTYIPQEAGSYTVTASAENYRSITSPAVTVANHLPLLPSTVAISPDHGVTTDTLLTASYNGSVSGVAYQWYKDGAPIAPGGTSTTYTPSEIGSYTVTASATDYEGITSDPVTVTQHLYRLSGDITIQSGGSGATAFVTGIQLTALYNGPESGITYQWNKDGTAITTGGNGEKYTPQVVGSYTVTVHAPGFPNETSAAVSVALPTQSVPGSVSIQSGNPLLDVTTSVTTNTLLTATYTGSGSSVTYQWKKGGIAIATGTNFKPSEVGIYTVTASAAGYLGITSPAVTVTVPLLAGAITIQSGGSEVTAAEAGTELTAAYSGSESGIAYQWNKNGIAILSGGNSTKFTPLEAGDYTVTVSAPDYQSKTSSNTVTVTLRTLAGTIKIQSGTPLAEVTNALTGTPLTASYTGGSETVTYQWNMNGNTIASATGPTYTPSTGGAYAVIASAPGYQSITSSNTVTVYNIRMSLSGTVSIEPFGPVTTGTPLTANYDGTEGVAYAYQWDKDGIALAGATDSTYTPQQVGIYTVTVSAAIYEGKPSSNAVAVTLSTLAGIIKIQSGTPPADVTTALTGTPLTAVYSGTENGIAYQWYKDGNPITSENSTAYTPSTAGSYTVIASAASYQSKNSNAVTVVSPLSGTITITPSGPNQLINTPLTASYTGSESGKTYQWYKDGNPITGTTGATYTPSVAGSYTVTVSAPGYDTKTSTHVDIVSTALPLSGTVTISPPGPVTVDTKLTASYTGSENVTYSWYKDGASIAIMTGETYWPATAGIYIVTAKSDAHESKNSNAVTVNLHDLSGAVTINPPGPVITWTKLTASYTGGSEKVSYWWYKGETLVAYDTTYMPTEVGSYTVTVRASGFQDKTSAPITVLATLSGSISISPSSGVIIGTQLTAGYTGSESGRTYQWYKGETAIAGATGTAYTPTETGSHTVTVSASGFQSKTSAPVTVLSTLSGTVTIDLPSPVTAETPLTASYTGSENVTYQWYKDGNPIATGPTYTPTEAGSYTVTVSTSGYQSIDSAPVTVLAILGTVTIPGTTSITYRYLTVQYSSPAAGPVYTRSYQWYKDGSPIEGATSYNFKPSEAGDYYVIMSAPGYQSVNSNTVTVDLSDLEAWPNIGRNSTGSIIDGTIYTGIELYCAYYGNEKTLFQWYKDGTAVTTSGTSRLYTPSEPGVYYYTVSAVGYNSRDSYSITVIGILTGDVTISQSSNPSLKAGDQFTVVYDGTESGVTYQWKKDGIDITPGGTGKTYTPSEEGVYTVTASIAGYISKTSDPVIITAYLIGETGPGGGVIYYYDKAGFTVNGITCHYLEAAPEDIPGTFMWISSSGNYISIPDALERGIGAGYANTAAILARDPSAPPALACKEYTNNGKNDWFLPSTFELSYMSQRKAVIGNFTDSHYWASTQTMEFAPTIADAQDFSTGQYNSYDKQNTYCVRAVRAF
ncbi:hypothetical protein AGMMS49928_00270 [Spirochaetia bacterium]|nr:hypothetical protein AGMMS49928_00270 [Spirochaetia bacterium]